MILSFALDLTPIPLQFANNFKYSGDIQLFMKVITLDNTFSEVLPF